MRPNTTISSSGTSRDVPVVTDSRVSYAPVEKTPTSYAVPAAKPKKPKK